MFVCVLPFQLRLKIHGLGGFVFLNSPLCAWLCVPRSGLASPQQGVWPRALCLPGGDPDPPRPFISLDKRFWESG